MNVGHHPRRNLRQSQPRRKVANAYRSNSPRYSSRVSCGTRVDQCPDRRAPPTATCPMILGYARCRLDCRGRNHPFGLIARVCAGAGFIVALGAAPASAATLKADYRFQGTRTSNVVGAPAVSDVGVGANTFAIETVDGQPRQVLTFPKANGVALAGVRSVVSPTNYSIVIDVRLADISGYRRLVDFSNGASDIGLYDFSGRLSFYNFAVGTQDQIKPNTFARIVLTRDGGGAVAGYVDGTPAFLPYDDSQTGAAVIGTDILRFFQDDGSVGGRTPPAPWLAYVSTMGRSPQPRLRRSQPRDRLSGRAVNVREVRGQVLVAVPAGSARVAQSVPGLKGVRFVPITQARQIPVGSLLDTRKGTVRLTSARDSKGTTQNGDFAAGVFQVLQSRAAKAKGPDRAAAQGRQLQKLHHPPRQTRHHQHTERPNRRPPAAAVAAHRPPPARKRQRPLQNPRPLLLRHRPRHQLDHHRPLRRHPHQSHPRPRHSPRPPTPQKHHPPRRQKLPRKSQAVGRRARPPKPQRRDRPRGRAAAREPTPARPRQPWCRLGSSSSTQPLRWRDRLLGMRESSRATATGLHLVSP